ncbi:MAG: YebC/PmpR family DNA-binding transcriptional regulator [Deltaproteobacteria bacterium]|nr:YebC/PmpR family DNA-binding transcriptional regulator [Deltaproteobacteria bacterium]
MSGHSKWATIKRKKGAIDAQRGKLFTKLVREITTAASIGGGDLAGNPRLRTAIAAAKTQSMPADKIDRAIKKGTGELEGEKIEEVTYEGYGPGGIAILIETQTDNRNRTTSEVRMVLSKNNGNLGATNSVAYMFHKRGIIHFDANVYSEDTIMEVALEAGAEDIQQDGESVIVTTDIKSFADVLDLFDKKEMKYQNAEMSMIPETTVKVSGDAAVKIVRLIERLEECDDVQKVYANFDIDYAELERIALL